MAAGLFVITELRSASGGTDIPPDAERFEWSAGDTMPGPAGGARAAPLGTWSLGVTQANVRTNYPGARRPTFQVLGPRRKPFTLIGKWDDRWNFPGYAVGEHRRFEAMMQRGRLVRCSFQEQVIDGLIVEFDPEYKGNWLVRYSITIEASERPGESSANRSPQGPLTPSQRFDDVALSVAALQDAAATVPASELGGSLSDDSFSALAAVIEARDRLGATLDQRDLRPSATTSTSLPRMATQFRQLGDAAQVLLDTMVSVRSDVDVTVQSAAAVLRFEQWSRSLRSNARLLLGRAAEGASDMQERASPRAEQLYRPFQGESLYHVSQEVYGTPHAWRLISERNNLSYFELTGEELLIIPERGAG